MNNARLDRKLIFYHLSSSIDLNQLTVLLALQLCGLNPSKMQNSTFNYACLLHARIFVSFKN